MKKYLLIPGLFIMIFGCANPYVIDPLQEQSANQGHVPCEAGMIEVIEHKTNPDGSEDWMALCQGDTYSCEKSAGQEAQITCQKMESQMPE
ncbi:MAG TPA: hypothetical protein VHC46_05200 [Thermodesulfobacteriota bacterium]|nr:hypothetical protein [Thermodesulfobacteriota bacterium]